MADGGGQDAGGPGRLSSSRSSSRISRTASSSAGAAYRAPKLTLPELEEDFLGPFRITSPRSLEALSRLGMLPGELVYRPLESFMQQGLAEEIIEMRFKHCEVRRRERIGNAKREWEAVSRDPGFRRHVLSKGAMSNVSLDTTTASQAEQHFEEHLKKQLDAMKRKQKEDIEEMLVNEFKEDKMREISESKAEAARQRELAMEEQRLRKAKEWELLKAEREQRKVRKPPTQTPDIQRP
jgi:hypothetical protein